MSMCLSLATLSDENIQRVLADPPLAWKVIAPDDEEFYRIARREAVRPSFLARLLGRKPEPLPEISAELEFSEGEGRIIDVDKAWQGLHYLLTGTAEGGEHPHNFLVVGGRGVADVEVGYGPARTFTAVETAEIHAALSALSEETLRSRFAPRAMMDTHIYPEIWDRDPADDDTLGYLMDNLPALREFLSSAAEQRFGMIVWLS